MGSAFSSTSNEAQKRSNVKLQAQQVPIFNGNPLMWYTWKKKTRAAVGTAGMLGILDDESYAVRSEERRVGKECANSCRSRWSPYH